MWKIWLWKRRNVALKLSDKCSDHCTVKISIFCEICLFFNSMNILINHEVTILKGKNFGKKQRSDINLIHLSIKNICFCEWALWNENISVLKNYKKGRFFPCRYSRHKKNLKIQSIQRQLFKKFPAIDHAWDVSIL